MPLPSGLEISVKNKIYNNNLIIFCESNDY